MHFWLTQRTPTLENLLRHFSGVFDFVETPDCLLAKKSSAKELELDPS
jgi:hypothetical protein